MKSRFTCFWTFIFLFALDKTPQCQEVKHYNISLTWMNANSKCGSGGLEHDATILSNLSLLRQKQFWIGIGIYKILSPWMAVLDYLIEGCYPLTKQRDISLESSTGLCLWKCNNTNYFSYKEHLQECVCLNLLKEDIYFGSKLSLEKCTKLNKSEAVLVHKVFHGDYQRSGKKDELCMTFICSGNQSKLYGTNCSNTSRAIQGMCEDGNPSLKANYLGVPYSTQLTNCKKRNMLLLHYNDCTNRTDWEIIWTNIFRENIEVEIPGGDISRMPVRCFSAIISATDIKDLQISQENCTSELNWFVCKRKNISDSNTTTKTLEKDISTNLTKDTASYTTSGQSVHNIETKTMAKDSSANFDISLVISGIGVAIASLAVLFVMIVCKIRSCGVFKTTNIDQQGIQLSTAFNQQSQNLEVKTSVTPTSNESYGIISTKSNNTYAVVNRTKKTDSELQNSDETHTETSYGEYDRLNGVLKRRTDQKENLYDSHVGIRNECDPTYDCSNQGDRNPQLDNNVYDHTDSILIDGYSTSVRSDIRNENDVYDEAV